MDLREYDEETLKMIIPLKEIMYEELVHLVNFLKGSNPNDSYEKKNENVFRRVGLFFPEFDAVQEVKFFSIISSILQDPASGKSTFEAFKSAYPEVKVYRDGSGSPTRKKYWTIRLDSLEQMFISISQKEKLLTAEKQILEAKTLVNLNGVKPTAAYPITKKIYFRSTNNIEINENIVAKLEKMLKEMNLSTEVLNKFMTKYMGKNWGTIRNWFKHFESRLDILYIEYKENGGILENDVNKEFLENLKRVCA